MRILKYQLSLTKDRQQVLMPAGAKILSAQVRGAKDIMLWAMTSQDEKTETREFEVIETGVKVPFELRSYIGTLHCTAFTVHVFEILKQSIHSA